MSNSFLQSAILASHDGCIDRSLSFFLSMSLTYIYDIQQWISRELCQCPEWRYKINTDHRNETKHQPRTALVDLTNKSKKKKKRQGGTRDEIPLEPLFSLPRFFYLFFELASCIFTGRFIFDSILYPLSILISSSAGGARTLSGDRRNQVEKIREIRILKRKTSAR